MNLVKGIGPKQFYFVMLGGLVTSVLAGSLAYYQAATGINRQSQSLRRDLADIQLSSERIDQLKLLTNNYNSLLPELPLIDKALPKAKKQSEIVLQIKQVASESGMSVPSFSFPVSEKPPTATSQTTPSGPVLALPIDLQLTGTYSQMRSFLEKLENLDRYNNITSLVISKVGGANNPLSFNITLSAYLQP